MKISKIFHTLYGFLMCLPIISILFVCVYVSVNPNAKDSYSGSEIQYRQIEYHSNEVNSVDDLVVGNVYKLFTSITINNSTLQTYMGNKNNYDFINNNLLKSTNGNHIFLRHQGAETSGIFLISINTSPSLTDYTLNFGYIKSFANTGFELYFIYKGFDNSITNDAINYIFQIDDLSLIPPQYEEVEVQKLDNAFYYSVNEINDNPLFSWAQNSFLVAPITYVVSLFGMTNNSPIVTMLSYWLTISIIWLVFDLIMYIPLLVHRWIDKGVVE